MTLLPSSVAELAAITRDAHDRRKPLRITGRGTWLGACGTVRTDAERLDVSGISGIVEYVPGDLTLTARTGTTLEEVDAATGGHSQWCPLLPWGRDDVTLGAVFATATPGPFSGSLGRPRDLALGLEFVDGTGAVARGGGRVVKNVAGFDLTRLLVGSWGTLGIITEVSVRLRARPKSDETWMLAIDADDATAWSQLTAFERGPYAPLASRRLDAADCGQLGLAARNGVLLRLGGNASFVAASRAASHAIGPAQTCDPAIWTRYRALDTAEPSVMAGNALSDPISKRLKQRFDPANILNPGLLGEAFA
ncbi:MAG: FAD-binding protein [Gemmatimonadales bacterium]